MKDEDCYHKIRTSRLEKLITSPRETPERLNFYLYLLNGRGCGTCKGDKSQYYP